MAPPIVWAQRPDTVVMTIQLADCTDVDVKFEAEKVSFKAKQAGKDVETELDLYSVIKPEESSFSNTGREIQIKLKKNEEGVFWNLLTKKKLSTIKIDWSRWKDEDEVEGADDFGDFGGGMPGGMGGMPGMPGMGGMGGGGMPGMDGMGGMDMEALMKQMGGMGGMPGMPGMGGEGMPGMPEGGDSDDEEPPAMEEKAA